MGMGWGWDEIDDWGTERTGGTGKNWGNKLWKSHGRDEKGRKSCAKGVDMSKKEKESAECAARSVESGRERGSAARSVESGRGGARNALLSAPLGFRAPVLSGGTRGAWLCKNGWGV
jgi:hypothetical protein